jgi:hypothetical protein
MRRLPRWPRRDADEEAEDRNRQTAGLAAIAVVLLLLVCGLFLVQTLRRKAALEDCLMSGRRNCDTMVNQH